MKEPKKRGIGSLIFLIIFGFSSYFIFFTGDNVDEAQTKEQSEEESEETSESPEPTGEDLTLPSGVDTRTAVVQEVIDGDTIRVEYRDTNETEIVRLLMMDTPETAGPYNDSTEAYGSEATETLKQKLIRNYVIELETIEGNEYDDYDRLLAHVWFQEENISEYMISEGLAEVAYVRDDSRYVDYFKEAEKEAQDKNLNIWSEK